MKEGVKGLIIVFVFLAQTISLMAQAKKTTIQGKVLDQNGKPIAFATVAILNTAIGTITNDDGYYSLTTTSNSNVEIVARCLGYSEFKQTVQLGNISHYNLNIQLEENTTSLEEIVVSHKSQITLKKEQPFSIIAIDAKPLQVKNLDINQVLNTTSGIRIREEGGMGSNFNFSLNGFTGNQVKFFLDGVPMDNFGSSLTLNNIPVNLISSIEVYKGVVPIHLGSDALGGAINVITNNKFKNFIDASYSFGSFNTHRLALVSRFTNEKTGITVNANAFYNYSDNDYEMTLSVASIENGGKYGPPEKIRRFHDAYESKTAQFEIGVMDKKYADRLFFGLIASGNYKELQTGHNMNIVIGEAFIEDKVLIPTVKYKKKNFIVNGLSVSVFANYNLRQALNADTSRYSYDWYKNRKPKGITSTSGEIAWNKTLFSYNDNSTLVTSNMSYEINATNSFSINYTLNNFKRVGEDPISLTAVPFSKPNRLQKNIIGLAYDLTLFKERLKTVIFAKQFLMNSKSFEGDRYNKEDTVLTKITSNYNEKAYGLASTLFLTKSTQLKVSFENTYRLPEPKEMFGDGLSLLSNLNIKPEESQNYNVGILSNNAIRKHRLVAELEYLYRLPKNMIRYKVDGNDGFYENQVSVRGYSIEGGLKYYFAKKVNIEVNGTYQKMVHNNKLTPDGGENYLYNQQLANMPYMFGNLMCGYLFENILKHDNNLSISWTTTYVGAFYLKSPINGAPAGKNDIPRQISNSLNASYSFNNGRYNISASCNNITNNELYDNWRLPKPGRAFNVKLRYYFQKSKS